MGQTKAQIVKKSLASEMSLNADAKIGKIEAVSDGREEYICQTCGKSYKRRKGNFSPSKSPIYAGTDGYLNTCKNCVDKYCCRGLCREMNKLLIQERKQNQKRRKATAKM